MRLPAAFILAYPLCAAAPALAAEHPLASFFPGTNTCYSRIYDKNHLVRHPKQRVVGVQIVHPFFAATSSEAVDYRMAISFRLKGTRDKFGPISTYCQAIADGTAKCSVEADGGRFTLSRGANNTLVITIDRLQLEGQNDFSPDLGHGGDDRVLVLQKSPMKACPDNKGKE